MIRKSELMSFLEDLPDDVSLAIDDGGLTLVVLDETGQTGDILEIGGIPLDDDDEFDAYGDGEDIDDD